MNVCGSVTVILTIGMDSLICAFSSAVKLRGKHHRRTRWQHVDMVALAPPLTHDVIPGLPGSLVRIQ